MAWLGPKISEKQIINFSSNQELKCLKRWTETSEIWYGKDPFSVKCVNTFPNITLKCKQWKQKVCQKGQSKGRFSSYKTNSLKKMAPAKFLPCAKNSKMRGEKHYDNQAFVKGDVSWVLDRALKRLARMFSDFARFLLCTRRQVYFLCYDVFQQLLRFHLRSCYRQCL